jgi:hypothetical protein
LTANSSLERGRYLRLRLAGDLTKLAEALDFLPEFLAARLDTVPPVGRKLSDDPVESPAHLISPSFRRSRDPDARKNRLSGLAISCLQKRFWLPQ